MIITNECTGCGACALKCPTKAIQMQFDEGGFTAPKVQEDLCVNCGLCQRICPMNNTIAQAEGHFPRKTLAVALRDKKRLKNSASGGAFIVLARWVLDKGGVVFGCAYDEKMLPRQTAIACVEDLVKLQGSKYVQSLTDNSFSLAKKYLEEDKYVLYTGTPCQIAGLSQYLGKSYEKLLTVDLICHGVPATKMFLDYIQEQEKKYKAKVVDFKFRDKSAGWKLLARTYFKKKNKIYNKRIEVVESCYFEYFKRSNIFRESCYSCKFANENRQGDFTIGDYWGVEKVAEKIDRSLGVSVVVVNSEKGEKLFAELFKEEEIIETSFEDAAKENHNLIKPTDKPLAADEVKKNYRDYGFAFLQRDYEKHNKKRILKAKIKKLIPTKIILLKKKLFR